MALKKADRLKAVGMLATQKTAYFMSNGKTDRIIINENPLANYFYYLCFEIGNLMQEIFMDYSENVYLFWVDGIFCNDKVKNEINKRVKLKYPCKIEEIKDLHYSKYGNYLLFKKDEKRKILPVPQRKLVDDGNILRFLV